MTPILFDLESDPYNWDLRLIYSDYLEESGDLVLATAQRYMGREKVFPYLSKSGNFFYWGTKICYWYTLDRGLYPKDKGIYPESCFLDSLVFHLLPDGPSSNQYWKGWKTLLEAETALGSALLRGIQ